MTFFIIWLHPNHEGKKEQPGSHGDSFSPHLRGKLMESEISEAKY